MSIKGVTKTMTSNIIEWWKKKNIYIYIYIFIYILSILIDLLRIYNQPQNCD